MAARGISTDGGPPAWAVESCCLDGRVGLAKQQGKRVAHRLSKWPTDVEMDGTTTVSTHGDRVIFMVIFDMLVPTNEVTSWRNLFN